MGCGGKEGAVYIVKPPERLPVDQDFDIFSYKETYYFEAPVVSPRIAAQSGVFTLHHDPQSAWEPACTVKIILPYGVCGKLKEDLQKLGVSESSLFPDIDGQAHGVNWLFKWGKL